MTDKLFGELEFDDMQNFCGKVRTDILGEEEETEIMIQAEDESEGVAESQRKAFELFTENTDTLREELMQRLTDYYNNELKYSYGDDSMWLDIDAPEDMKAQLEWQWIQIPGSYITDDAPVLYLIFHCKWEDDDSEPQGIAAEITEGSLTDIGPAEIAF